SYLHSFSPARQLSLKRMSKTVRGSLPQSSSRAEPFIIGLTGRDEYRAWRGFHLMTVALKRTLLCLSLILALAAVALAQPQLPAYTGMVNDFAGKLSADKRQQLESLLENFRARSGVEIAVVTMRFDDLQGYPIEDYSLQLARQWGVGGDSTKRALLLLVAIKE